jgi:hypothetical protein
MKRYILGILVIFITFGCTAQSKYTKVERPDFYFVQDKKGTKFGFDDSNEILIESLGDPAKSIKTVAQNPKWTIWNFVWPGLKIETFAGNKAINFIEITGKDFSSMRGIKIGDEAAKIVKKYGEPDVNVNNVLEYVLPTEDSVWGLDFFIKQDRVEKMVIGREN